MTVAEQVIAILHQAGVNRVYGLPGDSLNGFTDAIRKDGNIGWQHVRNEEAAAFAAGAEAHLTGELAVCAGSAGPGNLHLINGLYDCHRSRVPVLAIASHLNTSELGTNYFQATHPEHLFQECSHFCELATTPEQLPRLLDIAIRTAIAKRGVSVLVIPGDLFLQSAATKWISKPIQTNVPICYPNPDELTQAAEILNAAKKVTILGGFGCKGAQAELLATAEKLKAPIVHALRGKEFIEPGNPYDVGLTGLIGLRPGYDAMESCDALLMLGTDFPYPQFFPNGAPNGAKIIQVDIRGEQLGRRTPLDLGLIGTVKHTLTALLPKLKQKSSTRHLKTHIESYASTRKELDTLASPSGPVNAIHPQYVAFLIDRLAKSDAIFTCDVGSTTIWAARYLRMNGSRRLLGSFSHGSMAGAVPQAIGAQSSHPGRQVITLSGDGGIAMMLGDLLTLHQLNLPIKMVVFNNQALAFVELEMKAAGFLNYGTNLTNPSFADLAQSIGIPAQRIAESAELQPALERAFDITGPALVEVMVARQELSLPPNITLEQAKGFTLYASKAILNGQASEILDLAKTNLLQRIFN